MSQQSADFKIPPLWGKRGKEEVKKILTKVSGVKSVSLNSSLNRVTVDYDSTGTNIDELKKAMDTQGYTAELITKDDHGF